MNEYLLVLSKGIPLSEKEMEDAVKQMLSSTVSEAELAAFLMALGLKGYGSKEMHMISEIIRKESTHQLGSIPNAMDNCGTGGDRSNSFNISTASAFVLASAGIKMVKHGNKNMTSQSGSMDVLKALGIDTINQKEQAREAIQQSNLVFLNAGHIHPRLNRIADVRKQLGFPTIFNAIGPLTNPVSLTYQMVGVYDEKLLKLYGDVLLKAGRKRAAIIHGAGNMDEASLAGENKLFLIQNGKITEELIHPHDVGLNVSDNRHLVGGEPAENAKKMIEIFQGEKNPCRDAVILNAGIGMFVAEKASTIQDGVIYAAELIDSGAAYQKVLEARSQVHAKGAESVC